jgi:hypothetical protein
VSAYGYKVDSNVADAALALATAVGVGDGEAGGLGLTDAITTLSVAAKDGLDEGDVGAPHAPTLKAIDTPTIKRRVVPVHPGISLSLPRIRSGHAEAHLQPTMAR